MCCGTKMKTKNHLVWSMAHEMAATMKRQRLAKINWLQVCIGMCVCVCVRSFYLRAATWLFIEVQMVVLDGIEAVDEIQIDLVD